MKASANESFGYNEDEIVSSDIVGMRFGSPSMLLRQWYFQLWEWYNRGSGSFLVWQRELLHKSQMVRTIKHFGKIERLILRNVEE